jgi:nucleoside-diphosphate-sugar epimerase
VKYLVTGCAGFIGSRIAEMLLLQGHDVQGVDDLNDYYDISLKFHRLETLLSYESFSFARLGIENRALVEGLFSKHQFDAVINLAAAVGVRYSLENPHVYMTTNAVGNLNLLEAMRNSGVKKYVLASTSSLYAGQQMPFVETLPVNTPISPYAASKKSAESMAWSYHHLFDMDISVVRYFTVYGPAGRPDMGIFRFVRSIAEQEPIRVYGDGKQSRDFTYVDDIADGTIRALRPLGFEIINLGGGKRPVTLNEIIRKLASKFGCQPVVEYLPPHDADMQSTWANIEKAKQLLDWKPTVSIDEGLDNCADWYLANLPWSREIQIYRSQKNPTRVRVAS